MLTSHRLKHVRNVSCIKKGEKPFSNFTGACDRENTHWRWMRPILGLAYSSTIVCMVEDKLQWVRLGES